MNKEKFLEKYIYKGIENINNGFDSPSIFYCSESNFELILERTKRYKIGINGIEPWLDNQYYDVKVYEDYSDNSADSEWYFKAFNEYKSSGIKGLQYSASYFIPKNLLDTNH